MDLSEFRSSTYYWKMPIRITAYFSVVNLCIFVSIFHNSIITYIFYGILVSIVRQYFAPFPINFMQNYGIEE